jgi:hypothetical protein
MLQIYVSSVSDVSDVCSKCLFKMFHLFQTYATSVLSEYCICCNGYTHMSKLYVLAVSDICYKCFHESYTLGWDAQNDVARIRKRGMHSHVFARRSKHGRSLHARMKRRGRGRSQQVIWEMQASHLGGMGGPMCAREMERANPGVQNGEGADDIRTDV